MKRSVLTAAVLLALCASPAFARVMKVFELDAGRNEKNRIASPVYEGGADPIVVEPFVSKLAPGHKVIRRLVRELIPEFTLDPSIDLGKNLAVAVQTEGTAMGLRMSSSGTEGWTVSGTLDDVTLQTRNIPFGPILFYATMDVTLNVRKAGGEPRTVTYRTYNMYARHNGGFGLQDEMSEALANFLIDSSQEIVARLNRDFFHTAAHPSLKIRAETLAVAPHLDDREAELRMIGLSGSRDVLPILLNLLSKEKEEGNRVYVIDALANLGAPEAIQPLAQRYAGEDEDCRLFILKAWDSIGGDEARKLIAQHGAKDEDPACRAFAKHMQ